MASNDVFLNKVISNQKKQINNHLKNLTRNFQKNL